MSLSQEVVEQYKRASLVLLSKGRNRARVTELLTESEIEVPEFIGRCLHCKSSRQNIRTYAR
jgi:hypothetical protein